MLPMAVQMEVKMAGIMLIGLAAVFLVFGYQRQHIQQQKKKEEQIRQEFGQNPLKRKDAEYRKGFLDEIRIYCEETKERLTVNQVDETTWDDLDMDEVFFRINHTRSYIGEQVLYRRLHQMQTTDQWDNWERMLAYLTAEEKSRQKLEGKLECIGKRREDYYLPMFLLQADVLKVRNMLFYRVLQLLFFGSLYAWLLLERFWQTAGVVCMALFLGAALVNIVVYALGKEKYEVYLYALGSVKQLILFCRMTAKEPEWVDPLRTAEIKDALKSLEPVARRIGNMQSKKQGMLMGDVGGILWDYIVGATLWDITAFNRIMHLIEGKQEQLLALYEFTGGIDMAISVASFRKSLPHYCIPEFVQAKKLLGKQLYHPLLEQPVCNDVFLEKGCIITGANASGKSTFLKALAVNAVLAQTIHTCMAEQFQMPIVRVLTSIAVRDALMSGESYYIKEARYLKRIVEASEGELPVFCLIDEILRGTNTTERLAASEAVLRYLEKKNCLAAVATHDMELTEKLKGMYDFFSFQSERKGKNIVFDYRLHKGPGQNRNAVQLLSFMGFPAEIVEMAGKLCEKQ